SQADSSTTRQHGGTGLGLTICRQLVQMMGGRIWLESEPGCGTTIYFTAWFETQRVTAGKAVETPPPPGLNALIIDDNGGNRAIIRGYMDKLGIRSVALESGAAGLAAMEQNVFDLLLVDLGMPEMDGLDVVRRVKSRWPEGRTRIVMLSPLGASGDVAQCRDLGVDARLSKPIV